MNKSAIRGSLKLVLLLFFLAGCNSFNPSVPFIQPTTLFLPPTPVQNQPQPASTVTTPDQPQANISSGAPTSTVACVDKLTFVTDITIPDGTEVEPNATMDKRWEVENSGNCNWQENYRMRLVAGTDLGAQTEQALYPARSGSRAVLRVVFKAPADPGTYRSAWQAVNPKGDPFGDPFYIVITVK